MDNPLTSWAEIDLRAIRANIAAIRRLLDPAVNMMTIVKANAYGHGMIKVAQTCIEAGAAYLGVATLEEALALRTEHITAPILVLGYIPLSQAEIAVQNHIDVTVYNLEAAQAYAEAASSKTPARLHIKIDTGMGRIGFLPDEAALQTVMEINSLPNIVLQGIYTHFAAADELDKTYTRQQYQNYTCFLEQLEQVGIYIPIKHTANSAAIMDLPETHGNMVRAGIIIYGLYPSDQVQKERLPLKPAMCLKSRISHLKILPTGSSVSYGRRYVTEQDTLVATVPIGYADGYSRLLSNRAWASVNGQRVPLIGTVCMDQCMFDVSKVEGVKLGDEVLLFGRSEEGVTADDLADLMGTINYEIVSSIGNRIPRIYLD